MNQAQSNLSRFGAAAGTGVGHTNLLTGAMGRLGTGLQNAGNHLKGLISGPLGLIGLGGAAFGLERFFSGALSKTSEFAVSLEKLTGLTGESAQKMGELLLLTDKYGIDAGRTAQIVGFAEKTLGLLQNTTAKTAKATASQTTKNLELQKSYLELHNQSVKQIDILIKESKVRDQIAAATSKQAAGLNKLQALGKEYGISLTDANGKAIDFSTELGRVADYYTSNASAADKAALSAKLFGRGYATLIPILELGSKGIADQEQAYRDMGLTLGTDTQGALTAFQSALRNVGEAVNILQLQLGLALAPQVTKVANALSLFLEHGGAKQIVSVFTAIADGAEKAGAFIGDVGGKILGFWDAIPQPLRDWIFKGVVADRTLHFLFGISPIGAVAGGITSLIARSILGPLASKVPGVGGGLGVQHVWVDNLGPGGLGSGGPVGSLVKGAGSLFAGFGAADFAAFAALALLPVLPALITMAISDPKVVAAQNYAARQSTAAARGLNPANVPVVFDQPHSAAVLGPGGLTSYGSDNAYGRPGQGALVASSAFEAQARAQHAMGAFATAAYTAAGEIAGAGHLIKTSVESSVKYLLHGIEARHPTVHFSAAELNKVFQDDLLTQSKNIVKSNLDNATKLERLARLQADLKARGDINASRIVAAEAKTIRLHNTIPITVNVSGGQTVKVINTYTQGTTGVGGAGYTPGGA